MNYLSAFFYFVKEKIVLKVTKQNIMTESYGETK
jgi:hypothetical protein